MSMTDVDPSQGPPPGAGGGGPPDAGGGGPPAGPASPPSGGPMLAALARQRMAPPVSSPGQGDMAKGLMMLKSAVDLMQQALPSLGTGSPQHKDAIKAISSLSRHLPQGAPTAGAQQTQLMDMLRSTMRNALLQKLMAQKQGGQGGPPGPMDGGGGGAMPGQDQPNPSTPLPGA